MLLYKKNIIQVVKDIFFLDLNRWCIVLFLNGIWVTVVLKKYSQKDMIIIITNMFNCQLINSLITFFKNSQICILMSVLKFAYKLSNWLIC